MARSIQSGGPWTTTPLAGNAVYTSRTLAVESYGHVTGTVAADQGGTLFIDHSGDGVNFDYSSSFAVVAGTGLAFSVEPVAKYVRIRYVNGSTLQGSFRLYTFLRSL